MTLLAANAFILNDWFGRKKICSAQCPVALMFTSAMLQANAQYLMLVDSPDVWNEMFALRLFSYLVQSDNLNRINQK